MNQSSVDSEINRSHLYRSWLFRDPPYPTTLTPIREVSEERLTPFFSPDDDDDSLPDLIIERTKRPVDYEDTPEFWNHFRRKIRKIYREMFYREVVSPYSDDRTLYYDYEPEYSREEGYNAEEPTDVEEASINMEEESSYNEEDPAVSEEPINSEQELTHNEEESTDSTEESAHSEEGPLRDKEEPISTEEPDVSEEGLINSEQEPEYSEEEPVNNEEVVEEESADSVEEPPYPRRETEAMGVCQEIRETDEQDSMMAFSHSSRREEIYVSRSGNHTIGKDDEANDENKNTVLSEESAESDIEVMRADSHSLHVSRQHEKTSSTSSEAGFDNKERSKQSEALNETPTRSPIFSRSTAKFQPTLGTSIQYLAEETACDPFSTWNSNPSQLSTVYEETYINSQLSTIRDPPQSPDVAELNTESQTTPEGLQSTRQTSQSEETASSPMKSPIIQLSTKSNASFQRMQLTSIMCEETTCEPAAMRSLMGYCTESPVIAESDAESQPIQPPLTSSVYEGTTCDAGATRDSTQSPVVAESQPTHQTTLSANEETATDRVTMREPTQSPVIASMQQRISKKSVGIQVNLTNVSTATLNEGNVQTNQSQEVNITQSETDATSRRETSTPILNRNAATHSDPIGHIIASTQPNRGFSSTDGANRHDDGTQTKPTFFGRFSFNFNFNAHAYYC